MGKASQPLKEPKMTAYRSEFLHEDIDLDALASLVSRSLGKTCRLMPLHVKCTYPVFYGEIDGESPVFVKVTTSAEWNRTRHLLQETEGCELFAKLRTTERIDYLGYKVLVFLWQDVCMVPPEDMNEAQISSFVAGCVRLSDALQRVSSFVPLAEASWAPERLYAVLADYADRHPVFAHGLSRLLDIPVERRTFTGHRLFVLHGDFHAKNFAFDGDRFASVFDFDSLTEGLFCGDLVNALVERFSLLSLPASARLRLEAATRRILSLWPGSQEELVIAANVCRLRFAARRILKHPGSLWVVLDVVRRDRRICALLRLIEKSSGDQPGLAEHAK